MMPRGRPRKKERWEIEMENKIKNNKDLIARMSEHQKDSLKNIMLSVSNLMESYRCLSHPTYEEIVNLDNSYWQIKNAFETGENKND